MFPAGLYLPTIYAHCIPSLSISALPIPSMVLSFPVVPRWLVLPLPWGGASPAPGIETVAPGGGFSFPRPRRLPSPVSPSICFSVSNEAFPFTIVPVQEMLNFD